VGGAEQDARGTKVKYRFHGKGCWVNGDERYAFRSDISVENARCSGYICSTYAI
jgi:hypothetical protein